MSLHCFLLLHNTVWKSASGSNEKFSLLFRTLVKGDRQPACAVTPGDRGKQGRSCRFRTRGSTTIAAHRSNSRNLKRRNLDTTETLFRTHIVPGAVDLVVASEYVPPFFGDSREAQTAAAEILPDDEGYRTLQCLARSYRTSFHTGSMLQAAPTMPASPSAREHRDHALSLFRPRLGSGAAPDVERIATWVTKIALGLRRFGGVIEALHLLTRVSEKT